MARLAEIKYPTDPNNRSYRVCRQRWISRYARQIQLAVTNGAAPAISLAIRNIKSQLVHSSMERFGNLDKGIPGFFKEGDEYKELHADRVAYTSINSRGETRLQAKPPFNDGAVLSETHDGVHIRNESIPKTLVQSTINTNTDVRIENFQDGINTNLNNTDNVVLQLTDPIRVDESESS